MAHDRVRHDAKRGRNVTAQRDRLKLDVHSVVALFEASDAIQLPYVAAAFPFRLPMFARLAVFIDLLNARRFRNGIKTAIVRPYIGYLVIRFKRGCQKKYCS